MALTGLCFLAFFLFGFTDNLKGPTLPAVLAGLDIDFGAGGNILSGAYLGFLIATLLTGLLADRFGLKAVMLLAGACLASGVAGYSASSAAGLLGASLFIVGLGLGAFELGPNAIIAAIHQERKALLLNLLAVMHGLGSMLAPLFAGALFAMGFSWRAVYRWDLVLIGVFILSALALRFPSPAKSAALDFRRIPALAFRGNLPWFHAAIALYVAVEIGLASWLVTFLQQARGLPTASANLALSFFFALLMLGRLVGGFFVHRVGYLRSILLGSLGAAACLAAGLFLPRSAEVSLPAAGLFLSYIFPTITAAVSERRTENPNTVLGVLFTFAGLGGVFGPWSMAWGSQGFGLEAGFAVILLLAASLSAVLLILSRREGHGKDA
jgi:fucose permease